MPCPAVKGFSSGVLGSVWVSGNNQEAQNRDPGFREVPM